MLSKKCRNTSGEKTGRISFKNILQGKNAATTTPKQVRMEPRPYIVEQLNYTPELNIDIPEIDEHYTILEKQALICKFNCFCPKPIELFHWIFTNWTTKCEIHLCSKGFFVVNFPTAEARDIVIQGGP